VSLRLKIILYLVLIHLTLAAVAVFVLRQNRFWLLPVELFFLCSVFLGVKLVKSFFVPLDLIRTGTQFIQERDFTTRLLEVGQPEMDQLIGVYNRMIDSLREERLRVREQHYFLDKIINASPSAIVTFDFDQRIALVNPATEKLLQMTTADLLGRHLREIQSPFFQALDQLVVGEPQILTFHGRRRMRCQKAVFLDKGFPRQFLMIEELTDELRRTEKAAYEKLIRMMSHEVNNSIGASNSLLHSCLNYKGQLREEDRQDFENALEIAISRADHLNAFTRSFAEVIRLPKPHCQLCDVHQLLRDVVALLGPESQRHSIRWDWQVGQPLDPMMMDKNQMEQVFVNILKNAMEAIGESGTITLRLGKMGERAFVLFEDTGPGIPPEIQAHLFTPFFTTKENGQGIGLTLVQEILSQHNFDFSLESHPGQPTQFAIYF
jgi:nitrogen fixation/metabolism regulation signal transduction histidine kinase